MFLLVLVFNKGHLGTTLPRKVPMKMFEPSRGFEIKQLPQDLANTAFMHEITCIVPAQNNKPERERLFLSLTTVAEDNFLYIFFRLKGKYGLVSQISSFICR